MARKLKVLGLVLTATMAMSAVAATAAQAGEFTAEKYPATITGTQLTKHQFKFNMGTVNCNVATFHGSQAAAANMLTLGAAYNECSTAMGAAVNVNMTGCDYRLHAGETLAMDVVDGSLDIVCGEAGTGIDFEVPATGCIVKIQPQNGLNTVTYTDNTMAKDYDVDIALTSVNYKQNANCGGGEGAFGNSEYTGKSTITGEKEGEAVGVIVH
jgi:hypothetical protein